VNLLSFPTKFGFAEFDTVEDNDGESKRKAKTKELKLLENIFDYFYNFRKVIFDTRTLQMTNKRCGSKRNSC
jgi:hypothetical protein